ncbi:hypothetical protein CSB09_03555 [Candidatus Gracilibacteria bacterium]|nr:MAG: hypothetical protein CSB09_03555 [Candidatus Gracilibacteria bacterium]
MITFLKKYSTGGILCILLCTQLSPSFAIDTGSSGNIINAFKQKEKQILFESLPFTAGSTNGILEQEYKMNGLESLKQKIAQKQSEYEAKRIQAEEHINTLSQRVALIDASIDETRQAMEEAETLIEQKERKIEIWKQAQLKTQYTIDSYKKTILSYLANIYSQGNIGLTNSGQADIIQSMLLSDKDSDFFISDITYKTLVSELGEQFVHEYRELVRQQYVHQIQIQEQKRKIETMKRALQEQKRSLQVQKSQKESLMEVTQGKEELYTQYVQSQQQAQEEVETYWQKANEDYKDSLNTFLKKNGCHQSAPTSRITDAQKQNLSPQCRRVYAFFENENSLQTSQYKENTHNIFTWPVTSRRITAFFRDPGYFAYLGSHHDAVDIATPQSSPIYAPADGYVYYILPPRQGGYSYIALKHKDGFVSVYGHISEVEIEPYQFVRQGELIARSGGAPGTPGAGPMTSGAHLHFELWKDKKPVDPFRYMTLADVDYSQIPSRYQQKFVADIVERTDGYADTSQFRQTFVLRGNTEAERQKYMLSRYATSDFQDWNMWVDTALKANIDPSFLMCIGLSESTLGHHLKTRYNVGNVGNTDSGGVYYFDSPEEGVLWMGKTFNNKYLGHYTTIDELSRWGNQNGPIYASSASNWHNNTIKCLSALKGEFVADDFQFRLGQ